MELVDDRTSLRDHVPPEGSMELLLVPSRCREEEDRFLHGGHLIGKGKNGRVVFAPIDTGSESDQVIPGKIPGIDLVGLRQGCAGDFRHRPGYLLGIHMMV